jgi:ribokinase
MKIPKIVVVGSVNTDMVVKSERIPAPGETVTGGRFVMAAGGKGANQAVAAARLGAQVTLVAKVGSDVFGDQAVENYRREGIATDLVFRDPSQATGVALILVDEKGENSIAVAPGANFSITPDEVAQAGDRIRQADVLLLQLEIPMPAVEAAARIAAAAGVCVVLDPAPVAPVSDALLACVRVIKPNEHEAERLTGVRVTDEASARAAAERLLQRGVKHAVITLGPRGAVWVSAERSAFVSGTPVEAVDSTAAGDAFSGGLACAMARGLSMEEAVREASLVGALATTRLGAQPSMPTADALASFHASIAQRGRTA